MADAESVSRDNAGIDASGHWLPWRRVHMLREAIVGDLSTQTTGDAEAPNVSSSMYDQIVTLAKILTRRHNGLDIWDMVVQIHDQVIPTTKP